MLADRNRTMSDNLNIPNPPPPDYCLDRHVHDLPIKFKQLVRSVLARHFNVDRRSGVVFRCKLAVGRGTAPGDDFLIIQVSRECPRQN